MTIKFYSANWCGFCKRAHQLLKKYIDSGIIVVKDSNEAPKGVQGYPHFECTRSGQTHTGLPQSVKHLFTKLGRDNNGNIKGENNNNVPSVMPGPVIPPSPSNCLDGNESCANGYYCSDNGECTQKLKIGRACSEDKQCVTNDCYRNPDNPDLGKVCIRRPLIQPLYVDKTKVNKNSNFYILISDKILIQEPNNGVDTFLTVYKKDISGTCVKLDTLTPSVQTFKDIEPELWKGIVNKLLLPLFPCTKKSDWNPSNIKNLLTSDKLKPPQPCKNDKSVYCCDGEKGPKFFDTKTIVLLCGVLLLSILLITILFRGCSPAGTSSGSVKSLGN